MREYRGSENCRQGVCASIHGLILQISPKQTKQLQDQSLRKAHSGSRTRESNTSSQRKSVISMMPFLELQSLILHLILALYCWKRGNKACLSKSAVRLRLQMGESNKKILYSRERIGVHRRFNLQIRSGLDHTKQLDT